MFSYPSFKVENRPLNRHAFIIISNHTILSLLNYCIKSQELQVLFIINTAVRISLLSWRNNEIWLEFSANCDLWMAQRFDVFQLFVILSQLPRNYQFHLHELSILLVLRARAAAISLVLKTDIRKSDFYVVLNQEYAGITTGDNKCPVGASALDIKWFV